MDLNREERNVAIMNALYALGTTMGSVFVSVFVYNYTRSLELTIMYACFRYAALPLFSWLGGKLSMKHDINRIISVGLVLIVCALIILLLIRENIPNHVWQAFIVAYIYGSGEGMFWFAMNVLNQNIARIEVRNLYVSSLGILTGIANIIAPLLTALILRVSQTEIQGYIVIFMAVIVIYVYVAYRATKLTIKYRTPSFSVKELFLRKTPRWYYQKRIALFNSIREGYTLVLSGLLVYQAFANSGSALSYFNAGMSILSIATYHIVSKKLTKSNMTLAYHCGNGLLIIAMLSLSFATNIWGAIVFGVLNTVGTPFYNNPYQLIKMKTFTEESENLNVTAHVICLEVLLNIGRLIGFVSLVVLAQFLPSPLNIQAATLIMAAGAVITSGFTIMYSTKFKMI